MKLSVFIQKLEDYAPLKLSKAFIDKGAHDNSGVIIKTHDDVKKVLFTLDLSLEAINCALSNDVDTIVTHHPAIYYPVSSFSVDNGTKALVDCIKNDINVISMHLNLDIAKFGIDYYLAKGLGAKEQKVITPILDEFGYGREFLVNKTTFKDFVQNAKEVFSTNNLMVYGDDLEIIEKVASFCGGGSSDSLSYSGSADVIVTTDMPHHVIKEHTERGRKILILTHYASEFYGFKKFYEYVSEIIPSIIFDDKRYL